MDINGLVQLCATLNHLLILSILSRYILSDKPPENMEEIGRTSAGDVPSNLPAIHPHLTRRMGNSAESVKIPCP